jgi:hypothetical protein
MRKTRMRKARTRPSAPRTALLTAALLPPLLLVAACSSSGSDTPDGAPSPSSVLSGKAPLTKEQLIRALVNDNDLPGWVIQPSLTQDPADDSTLTAGKPRCQPLADVTSSKPKIHRMAFVGATFAKSTAKAKTQPDAINQMLVASHAPGDAKKVIESVKAALDDPACASFTTVDNTGTTTPFTVRKGPAVKVGDASASYVMTDSSDKKTGAALVTVVQTGDTVTAYLSVKSAGGAGELPVEVATKEDAKLKAVLAKQR